MQPSNFELEVEDDGALLVLRLRGELDLATVPTVEATVDRHGAGRQALVVDLRELDFMDSSGVRLMLQLRDRHDGTEVAFVAPGERVGRLLDMTGVRSKLTWVTEPREALAGERN
jgi:anti-sigma B factor antagonist